MLLCHDEKKLSIFYFFEHKVNLNLILSNKINEISKTCMCN